MREIKFRAWDNKEKWMDDFLDMFIRTNEDIYEEAGFKYDTPNLEVERVNTGRYEIMQYTGIKDKNGKEIYEGDIIKYTHDWEVYPEKNTALVEFKKGGFEPLSLASGGVYYGMRNSPVYEIIGNIYENPELLKEVTE